MPDRRSYIPRFKKACRCSHGIAIHGVNRRAKGKRTYPCRHPGCTCRDYRPVKKAD